MKKLLDHFRLKRPQEASPSELAGSLLKRIEKPVQPVFTPPASPRSIRPAWHTPPAPVTQAKRSPAPPDRAAPAEMVTLTLGDFLDRIPAELLEGKAHDPMMPLPFDVGILSERMARGDTTITLTELFRRIPDIFRSDRVLPSDCTVVFPWEKMLSLVVQTQAGSTVPGLSRTGLETLSNKLKARRLRRPSKTSPLPGAGTLPAPMEVSQDCQLEPGQTGESVSAEKTAFPAPMLLSSPEAPAGAAADHAKAGHDGERAASLQEAYDELVQAGEALKAAKEAAESRAAEFGIEYDRAVAENGNIAAARDAAEVRSAELAAERDAALTEVAKRAAERETAAALAAELTSQRDAAEARTKELAAERDAARAEAARLAADSAVPAALTAQLTAEREAAVVAAAQLTTERDAARAEAASHAARIAELTTERQAATAATAQLAAEREAALGQVAKLNADTEAAVALVTELTNQRDAAEARAKDLTAARDAALAEVARRAADAEAAAALARQLTAERDAATQREAELQKAGKATGTEAGTPEQMAWQSRAVAELTGEIEGYRNTIQALFREREALRLKLEQTGSGKESATPAVQSHTAPAVPAEESPANAYSAIFPESQTSPRLAAFLALALLVCVVLSQLPYGSTPTAGATCLAGAAPAKTALAGQAPAPAHSSFAEENLSLAIPASEYPRMILDSDPLPEPDLTLPTLP